MVREFKDTYYYGNNMYFVVCGDVNHDDVTQAVASGLSSIPAESKNGNLMVKENEEKPIFTPSSIQIRDDDVEQAHVGVF
jgi:predicted Zn-dependent peptidase